MFGAGRRRACRGLCPFLHSHTEKQQAVSHEQGTAELGVLWMTPMAMRTGWSEAVPGTTSFHTEAPQGHPWATLGASDETDVSSPFQSFKKTTGVGLDICLPVFIAALLNNSQKVDTTQVSING